MFKEAVDGRKGVTAFENEEHFEFVNLSYFRAQPNFFLTQRCSSRLVYAHPRRYADPKFLRTILPNFPCSRHLRYDRNPRT